MAMERIMNGIINAARSWHNRLLANELNKLGLRYEDLVISSTPAMKEAMELVDPEVVHGRMRRLKRASDLIVKQKYYTDYAEPRPLEEIFKFDIVPYAERIEERNLEIEQLNMHKK